MFGLSIIKHVTLQKIVAHDFRYDPRIYALSEHPVSEFELRALKSWEMRRIVGICVIFDFISL